MLNTKDGFDTAVHTTINEILEEADLEPMALTGTERLADLGFTSLLLARLIIQLEAVFQVDPFEERFVVSDVRTVDELVSAYQQVLDATIPG